MYTPSPSTFYTPTFPFLESRLENLNNKTIFLLHRGIRLCWILFCLPIHIISILLLYTFSTLPIPHSLIPASIRHPNWTLSQSLIYPIISRLLYAIASSGTPPNLSSKSIPLSSKIVAYLSKLKVNVRQEDIRLPKDLNSWIKNEAIDPRGIVIPKEVSCFWLETEIEKGDKGLNDLEIKIGSTSGRNRKYERVVLFLAGGGYVIGSPLMGTRCYSLAAESGLKIFGIDYRKALDASNAYPAALQDAIVGYAHLLSLGYRDICLAGDSAGSGLCLTLLMYLNQLSLDEDNSPPTLNLPSALLLYSPWVDLSASSYSSISDSCDFINPTMMAASRDLYLVNLPFLSSPPTMTSSHPFFSPALKSSQATLQLLSRSYDVVEKPLRILMISGGGELLAAEIGGLVRNLKGIKGVELEWIEEKDELHVFFLLPHFISSASKRALENAGRFLRS